MIDLLAIWGVTQAVGFVFKPILEDLAKDAAKDYVKDFFKTSLGNVIKGLDKQPLEKATGKAIKEFLGFVQQELEDADLDAAQLKQYTKPLKLFIKNPSVLEILGSAFEHNVKVLDTKTLAIIGNQINLRLPEDFIQRWHDLTYQDEGERERKRERLKRAIKDSSAIKQLSGNPLLLTMMAILNRHQELPRDRAELYNQASRVLLQQWDTERALVDARIDPMTIDYKEKRKAFKKKLTQLLSIAKTKKTRFLGMVLGRSRI